MNKNVLFVLSNISKTAQGFKTGIWLDEFAIPYMKIKNEALKHAFDRYSEAISENFFKYNLDFRTNAKDGRRAELLKNPEYRAVLDKYR